MKLSDNDIIKSARRLRAEQNQQVKLQPWPKRQNNIVRYIAISAACLISFFLGFGLRISSDSTDTKARLDIPHDTIIYHTTIHDTIFIAKSNTQEMNATNVNRKTSKATASELTHGEEERESQGCSMLCDEIRYDLLANVRY